MDIDMPEMNGFEATVAIRELENQKKINWDMKIIINTAFVSEESRNIARNIGANAFCTKPIMLN